MCWKKRLAALAGVLIVFLCLLGAWYFGHYTRTPDYALQQVGKSLTKQDVAMFSEYVDIDGLLNASYDDFMSGILETGQPMNDEAQAAVESFAQMVRAPLVKSFHQAIVDYVATGAWPDDSENGNASGCSMRKVHSRKLVSRERACVASTEWRRAARRRQQRRLCASTQRRLGRSLCCACVSLLEKMGAIALLPSRISAISSS